MDYKNWIPHLKDPLVLSGFGLVVFVNAIFFKESLDGYKLIFLFILVLVLIVGGIIAYIAKNNGKELSGSSSAIKVENINQESSDGCQSVVAGRDSTINNISGVPPEVAKTLAKIVDEQKIDIAGRDTKILELEKNYKELDERFREREKDDTVAGKAKEMIEVGDFEGAEAILKDAFEKNKIEGENNLQVAAENAYEVAKLKILRLDYQGAMNFYKQAVELDQNNPMYLNDYGVVLSDLGKNKEALGCYEKVLKIDLDRFGRNSPQVAVDYNNIGCVYSDFGEHKKAIDCFEKALNIDIELYGENHPNVATRYNNIGSIQAFLGEHKKAIDYFEKALKVDLDTSEVSHPRVAIRYNNIGSSWCDLGDYKKAEDYFKKALKIDQEVYGELHPNIAIRYNNLGSVYKYLGEHKKAIDYLEKGLKIDIELYGGNHPNVAIRYNNIGLVYHELGEYDKALAYYEDAVKIDIETYGSNHKNLAIRYNNIGGVWLSLGDKSKAREYYEKSLEIYTACFGSDHPSAKNAKKILKNIG